MNKDSFKVACVQLNTKKSLKRNLKHAIEYIYQAIKNKAKIIITPETINFISLEKKDLKKIVNYEKDDVFLSAFKEIAKEESVWILIGSIVIKDRDEKIFNRSYLISDKGKIVSQYNKIHMFDVKISNSESYNESSIFSKGKKVSSYPLPWGRIGLTICYDLRFPGLYRKLAQKGSIFITVPSAFTRHTGKIHWNTLLRARAIENGVFIFAAAQCGINSKKRKTYGHSLIIDPSGKILADAKSKPGVIYSIIKPKESEKARKIIPSWKLNQNY